MRSLSVALVFALIGWAGCAAVMALGPLLFSIQTTLVIHAVVGPLLFGVLAWVYQSRFRILPPLSLAILFTGFVVVVDFLVVALLILGDLEMFTSWLGTWLPFSLIFLISWGVGTLSRDRSKVG